MERVINVITTPLALAALVLLIFGGLLYRVVQTQTGERKRESARIVNWTFVSVLFVSLLANISYLVQIFLFSETLITGSVRDEDNNPIRFAYVDIQSVGRTATSDDGGFQVSVPYSRQGGSYDIFASAPGFASYAAKLEGQRPASKTIILRKLKATLDNSMQIQNEIIITQNVGLPLIDTMVKFTNTIDRSFNIEDLSMVVTPPDGKTITLIPIYMKPIVSQYTLPPVHPLPVPVNSKVEMAIVWGENPRDISDFLNKLVPTMPFHPADFCTKVRNLPANVTQSMQSFFNIKFFWKSGSYNVHLSGIVENVRYEKNINFSLSGEQSNNINGMSASLGSCTGVGIPVQLPEINSLLVADGIRTNYLRLSTWR